MANQWVRLWVDMPTDPKFRTIARVSGQPLSVVISVFVIMMTDACNAVKRGETQINDDDVSSALDIAPEHVSAIREAMQGRVLDGNTLRGWERRQPKREDNSYDRVRTYRNKIKTTRDCNAVKRNVTQCNAPDTDTDTDNKPPFIPPSGDTKRSASRGTRLSPDWCIGEELLSWFMDNTPQLNVNQTVASFRDYWIAQPGQKGVKTDWSATFRNWCRRAAQDAKVDARRTESLAAKAARLGMKPKDGESQRDWDDRVRAA